MTGFNHTLTGCLIAVVAPTPLAPLLAFLSHFMLDALPHFGRDDRFVPYNRNFIRLLMVDAVLCVASLGFAIVLFPEQTPLLIICSAAATLPDFLWAVRDRAPRWLSPQYAFHHAIQWGERPYGWIFEAGFTALTVTALLAVR